MTSQSRGQIYTYHSEVKRVLHNSIHKTYSNQKQLSEKMCYLTFSLPYLFPEANITKVPLSYSRIWNKTSLESMTWDIWVKTLFVRLSMLLSMVKDTKLLGAHNLFPCLLLLFQPTTGQVLVCESAVFWDFFTSSLQLEDSAFTAASHHLSLLPSPV